jgi:hypothetical protein
MPKSDRREKQQEKGKHGMRVSGRSAFVISAAEGRRNAALVEEIRNKHAKTQRKDK